MTENAAEIALGLALGGIVALARWRAYRWRATPLGQAEIAFERRRAERERQRLALEPRASPAQSATLAVLVLAFLTWAASRALL
jgi:hypothetical protein